MEGTLLPAVMGLLFPFEGLLLACFPVPCELFTVLDPRPLITGDLPETLASRLFETEDFGGTFVHCREPRLRNVRFPCFLLFCTVVGGAGGFCSLSDSATADKEEFAFGP